MKKHFTKRRLFWWLVPVFAVMIWILTRQMSKQKQNRRYIVLSRSS